MDDKAVMDTQSKSALCNQAHHHLFRNVCIYSLEADTLTRAEELLMLYKGLTVLHEMFGGNQSPEEKYIPKLLLWLELS